MAGAAAARGRPRWLVPALLVGAPLAFLLLLVVQGLLAARAERLPDAPHRVEARVGPAGADGAPLRLVLLGDSTVAGVGAPTLDGTLPVQVAERVAADLGRPVSVMGYGVSGARTADVVAEQLPRVADDAAPDVVVVVIGSNDVTHLTPPWQLRREVAEMAEAVEARLGAPVVLGGIPLFGAADLLAQPLRSVVDAYAGVLRPAQRRAAEDAGVAYVEIARDASPRFDGVPDAMASDGFHPSPIGYGFWADAIAPVVVEVLGGP
jgi:lysophospholipase L1-like esterase